VTDGVTDTGSRRAGGQGRPPASPRRRWLALGATVYLAIVVAVAGALLLLGRSARRELDAALGERLLGVATTAAHLVDGDSVIVWSLEPDQTLEMIWLASRLSEIRRENDLAELTLTDLDERVLISAAGRLEKGEPNLYWDLDREAVQVALGGFPAVSRLYRSGGFYQKSAHVPIFTADGQVTGVLTVEGDADFFAALAALRRGSILTAILVVAFLSLMGWLLLRLQRAMERYRARVLQQENLAAMGRMTAGIAHEIRNPLSIISGTAQQLKRRLAAAGIEDESVDYIPEEVARLDRILHGYLALGSDARPEPRPMDLVKTVRRAVQLVARELATTGVSVQTELPGQECRLVADPHRLQQVLLNLLLNARDAMPNGGRVTVHVSCARQEAVLRVSDEGTGLQGVAPEKLFAPFWTGKEKGSGLGLPVGRRIVEEMGGSLMLKDRDDGVSGAVAELRLPR
jgi:signal transduction histidine kinase